MTGRNDPCPCGSGKKLKKCCVDKGCALGLCADCGAAAIHALGCTLCDKRYAWCAAHETANQTRMNGHVLRAHPEALPRAMIDKILDSPSELALLRSEAAREPGLWAKLMAHLEERQRKRAS